MKIKFLSIFTCSAILASSTIAFAQVAGNNCGPNGYVLITHTKKPGDGMFQAGGRGHSGVNADWPFSAQLPCPSVDINGCAGKEAWKGSDSEGELRAVGRLPNLGSRGNVRASSSRNNMHSKSRAQNNIRGAENSGRIGAGRGMVKPGSEQIGCTPRLVPNGMCTDLHARINATQERINEARRRGCRVRVVTEEG